MIIDFLSSFYSSNCVIYSGLHGGHCHVSKQVVRSTARFVLFAEYLLLADVDDLIVQPFMIDNVVKTASSVRSL